MGGGKEEPPTPAPAEGRGALGCSSALTDEVGGNGDYRPLGAHREAGVGRQDGRVTGGRGGERCPRSEVGKEKAALTSEDT